MREYTIQFMLENDWVRVGAIYSTWEGVAYHATELLADGSVIRILGRTTSIRTGQVLPWHTLRRPYSNSIELDRQVPGCPS